MEIMERRAKKSKKLNRDMIFFGVRCGVSYKSHCSLPLPSFPPCLVASIAEGKENEVSRQLKAK